MELREMIPVGYRAYTGRILNQFDVDSYNFVQQEINAYILAGRKVPDDVLNRSAFIFKTICWNLSDDTCP